MERSKGNAGSTLSDRSGTDTLANADHDAGETDRREPTISVALNSDKVDETSIMDERLIDRTQLIVSIEEFEAIAEILERPPNAEPFQRLMAARTPWKN